MLKGYKYQLKPTKEQEVLLMKHFGCCRFVYNYMLALHDEEYKKDKSNTWNRFKYQKLLPIMKKTEELGFLKEVNAQSLQSALINLDDAFKRFFSKKCGYPKFKSRKNNEQSFNIPSEIKLVGNMLFIPKFKDKPINVNLHREIKGSIRNATIKMINGKYYVSILVEDGIKVNNDKMVNTFKAIGIDLGVKEFAIFSDGTKIQNPKYYVKSQKKLANKQRKHFRKIQGSNNYAKSKLKLAKLSEHIANQRKDFHHKLSHKIVNDKQIDIICMEDLNVKGMVQNHCLAKSISDAGWSQFKEFIEYKAERLNKLVIKIGRYVASSRLCSVCGYKNNELKLSDREWLCPICKTKHDRDINAAINIKNIGLSMLGTNRINAYGDIIRPLKGRHYR